MEWDVKIGDPIEYFDPNLSYEITKYRPINKTQGLDFNPDWFREDALAKMSTGKYSGLSPGTKSHWDFWKERFKRCVDKDLFISIHHDSVQKQFIKYINGCPTTNYAEGFSIFVSKKNIEYEKSLEYAKIFAEELISRGRVTQKKSLEKFL